MTQTADHTGRRFGRLVAIRLDGKFDNTMNAWLCQCDCGTATRVRVSLLNSGATQSCGCLRRDMARSRFRTHGQSVDKTTPAYNSWASMKQRCDDPGYYQFENYGGRGISYDPRWASFANFHADMGDRPAGKTLDRIDNDGNYTPENCRWATYKEQANNRRPRGPNKNKLMRAVHGIVIREV